MTFLLYITKFHFGLMVAVTGMCEVFSCFYGLRSKHQTKLAVCTCFRILEKMLVPYVSDKAGFDRLALKCILLQAEYVLCIDSVCIQVIFLSVTVTWGLVTGCFTRLSVFSLTFHTYN